jgi:NAD(P)-dependent dehydrogenase (short-subunit alcohol dehydrogenase family)
MSDFAGKVLVITGSATGLGAAMAVTAARQGAEAIVLNCTKSLPEAEETAAEVRAAGAAAVIVQGDVSDHAACRAIAEAAAPYGRIDALINNAGITKHVPNHAEMDALAPEDFQRLYAVNVVGPFLMTRAARPLMDQAERAAVLMVSSIAGVTGIGSSVAYAATKGALNTMTLSLARALAPRIRVNAICPGFIDTRWFPDAYGAQTTNRIRENVAASTPLKAASSPQDIAEAGLFLVSAAARHITGETLMVDAGMHLGFAPLAAR